MIFTFWHFLSDVTEPSLCRDTVSSIGIFRRNTLPLANSMDHVCFFRHALALDECRAKFMAEYVMFDAASSASHHMGHTKEVWFPGTHSDMYVQFNFSRSSVVHSFTVVI